MNVLSRDQQIQIIACLTEGQSIRATERLTGVHRETILRLGERVDRGCAELHDRMMVGVRSSANGYKSHGAVIDYGEAKAIGLDVDYLEPADAVWSRLWLLYCMYDFDSKARNLGKIFEGAFYSIGRPK